MVDADRKHRFLTGAGIRSLQGIAVVVATIALAACGGKAPGSDSSGTGGGSISSIEVSTSKSSMAARADESVDVTVTALNASRRALSGVAVQIAASSGVLAVSSTATDGSGKVTAKFTLGQDRSNRTVTIQASGGGATGSATIQVTGTTLSLSSNTSVVSGASATAKLTARLLDAASQPISGAAVVFSTNQGNLNLGTTTTDSGGFASAEIAGISSSATVTAQAGNTSSNVTILASGTGGETPQPAGVVIRDLIIQANPSVTGPNQAGNSGNFSAIEVRVFGDLGTTQNIPVKNAPVRFRIASSPALGTLDVNTSTNPALTNDTGLATNRFVPGSATSGTDFVVICASVDGLDAPSTPGVSFPGNPCGANEKAVRLTIAQAALFVKLSTDNLLLVTDGGLTRTKQFTVNVTDAAGRGVPGVLITPRLLPLNYYKGFYFFDDIAPPRPDGATAAPNAWLPAARVQCANEDTNFNGILDPADNNANGDAFVWPGQIAAVSVENNGLTDATGFVVMKVKFGVRFGTWADYQVEARASVGGSEGLATTDYLLSVLVDEVKNKDLAPAWAVSPFGTSGSCNNPN